MFPIKKKKSNDQLPDVFEQTETVSGKKKETNRKLSKKQKRKNFNSKKSHHSTLHSSTINMRTKA